MSRSSYELRVTLVPALILSASIASAQSPHIVQDAIYSKGFHAERNYFSPEPWESFDTVNGNVLLTFTDLLLPGNAGRELRFQRVYNNQRPDHLLNPVPQHVSRWSFGFPGMVMYIEDSGVYPPPEFQFSSNPATLIQQITGVVRFVMADGAVQRTIYQSRPDAANPETLRRVVSSQFYVYDRTTRTLRMPDGTICHYDADGYLTDFIDPFGNTVTLDRTNPGSLLVTQDLGQGQVRQVDLTLNSSGLPTQMTFNGRTWEYEYASTQGGLGMDIISVTPPVGPGWTFAYDPADSDIIQVTTPHGGQVDYVYETRPLFNPSPPHEQIDEVRSLKFRDSTRQAGAPADRWTINLGQAYWGTDPSQWGAEILTPSGSHVTFLNGPLTGLAGLMWDRGFGGQIRIVSTNTFVQLEREELLHSLVPTAVYDAGSSLWFGTPEVTTRTIVRDGRTYTTTYAYNTALTGGNFGDYHNPISVVETSNGATRTTTLAYEHYPAAYVMGNLKTASTTVGPQTFHRSWDYNPANGFRTAETKYGLTTTLAPDAFGNVGSVTTPLGHTTTYAHSWGNVSEIRTPGDPNNPTLREINPDGTVASETRGGRTTTFDYDVLLRPTHLQPPGATNPTVTAYGDSSSGSTVTVTRGSSATTTSLDGFGRPIATVNSVGIRTTTQYDSEGRVIKEPQPFVDTDTGATITYDELGRIRRRTHPDGSYSERSYGPGTVTIRDENGRATTQSWQAFGHPDDARLVAVTDATNQTWQYSYNAVGSLETVTAPDGTNRQWQYNSSNQLVSEIHPESGTTGYAYSGHRLSQKTDANGFVFVYTYDENDRVRTITVGNELTTFTYEDGSDNRKSMDVDSVHTDFGYDAAGRRDSRVDTLDGYTFTTTFGYDNNNNLTSISYPSFGSSGNRRQIGYEYDSEHRLTRVRDLLVTRDFATNFSYHASGALLGYTAGNGVPSTFTYHPTRYWITSLSVGSHWSLQYGNYDNVGNVRSIIDSRAGMNQDLVYDYLDRLISLSAGPGYPSAQWAYDVHGNRTDAYGTTYTYYPGKLRLWTQNTDTYSYDNNGNLLTATTPSRSFTYTAWNRVASATMGGTTTSYRYDADDWRVKKTSGPTTTYLLRGLNGELLTEWKNPGTSGETRDYIYAGSRLITAIARPWNETADWYGTITPDGPPVTVSLETPGRRAWLTVDATTNQRVSLRGSNGTIANQEVGCDVWVTLYKPDNTPVSGPGTCMEVSGFMDVKVLSDPGAYKILVDPTGNATGSLTLTMYDVPPDVTEPITPGVPLLVSILKPGQNAYLTFTGTTGQRISLRGTNASITGSIVAGCDVWSSILRPDGTALTSSSACMEGGGFMDVKVLPADGTYQVFVNPTSTATGTATLTLYDVLSDVSGTLTYGTAFPVVIEAPGQNALLTFTGTQNQRITLLGTAGIDGSIQAGCDVWASVRDPSDVLVPGSSTCLESGGFMDVKTLPATGIYTIPIDPVTTATGTTNLTVYLMPPDAGGSLTIGAAPLPVSIPTPGQVVALTFAGTSGQQVTVRLTGNTIGHQTVRLHRPDGSIQTSLVHTAQNFNLPIQTLGSTGTYKVVVDPTGANTGNINVQVTSP